MDPISGSPYVREARSATYQVDAGRSTVMAWFTRQFARRGDGSALPGTLGNYYTGSIESSLSFSKRPGSTLSITMTFYATAANRTRYAFWVTQVVPPPRPHRTEIPTSLVGLTGAIVTNGQSHSVTSRNSEALGLLARRIDSLTHLDLGNHCPAILESASLRLVAKNGSHISVNIESGCSVTVNGIAWEDYPSKPIWSALMAATQSPP